MKLNFGRARAAYFTLTGLGKIRIGAGSSVGRHVILSGRGGNITIGQNTKILQGAILDARGGHITIGDNCSVNPYTILYGKGGLTIGNWVRIAAHCVIVPANHNISDLTRPISRQGSTAVGITIADDVWIGANVTVLDGAVISSGCVIAAGAVVRGDTVANGVYAGVPAKLIKIRGTREETVIASDA